MSLDRYRIAVVTGASRGIGAATVGSTAGTWPLPGMPVYGMTKAALHDLSQTLRLDFHGSGVRVSEIAPGRVETGVHLAMLADRQEARRRFCEGCDSLLAEDVAGPSSSSSERPSART